LTGEEGVVRSDRGGLGGCRASGSEAKCLHARRREGRPRRPFIFVGGRRGWPLCAAVLSGLVCASGRAGGAIEKGIWWMPWH
jgi:hypothetical protein